MKFGKYRDFEIGWDGRMFAKGTTLIANFEESFVAILGIAFITRRFVDRGLNVKSFKAK